MPVVLPHDVLNALHKEGRLPNVCPTSELRQFWKHFGAQQLPWAANVPPDAIPLGLHGDDARYTDTGAKIIAVSLNCLLDPAQDRWPLIIIRAATWYRMKSVCCSVASSSHDKT